MVKQKTTLIVVSSIILSSCAMNNDSETLASLRNKQINVKEEKVPGSLEKAMQSYKQFLDNTPESELTPEAIRRLADLKLEKEYGIIHEDASGNQGNKKRSISDDIAEPSPVLLDDPSNAKKKQSRLNKETRTVQKDESDKNFERRATQTKHLETASQQEEIQLPGGKKADPRTVGSLEAIKLYKELLRKYPHYKRNDQVLYQLSRAYEEIGQVEKAMGVMNKIVKNYPASRYIDEVQFRRAEYYFIRKKYLSSEEAYQSVLNKGIGSEFYELSLYKQGWSYFKQELYERALHNFIKLLDYKVANGMDFNNIDSKSEKKHIDDTFRVISLSFSYLGGAPAVVEYFTRYGARDFEVNVYSNLGEYYLDKRRYSDAASAYNTFVDLNRFHEKAPDFHTRVIEIYKKGGFPKLVLEAKKDFANNYALNSAYWSKHDIKKYQHVVDALQNNVIDLAKHYHAIYQDKKFKNEKVNNYSEAIYWYKQYLESFPDDSKTPGINYLLADLYRENHDYKNAAKEYERTAYNYPKHEKSSKAGYAAVYAYRELIKRSSESQKQVYTREVIRSSLKFVDTYPNHKKAPLIMAAAVDDLYEMRDYELAVKTGQSLLEKYPDSEDKIRYSAQLVVAHGSLDLMRYPDAEKAYLSVLKFDIPDKNQRREITENLAASIYKQGEQQNKLENYEAAANHFLRVGKLAPRSKIRPTAEYDAAAVLIKMKRWSRAASVLVMFRNNYPRHELVLDVTKKLAVVYKEDGRLLEAASEFERIEKIETNPDIRREALLQAAELYEEAKDSDRALSVYNRYVKLFPEPLELVLETRQKIATIYKKRGQNESYFKELKHIVEADAKAGSQRTDRTRYLAAMAALELSESWMAKFKSVKLNQPFKENLLKKKKHMKKAISVYSDLVDYGVGETTAAATYHIAEIYYHFNRSLLESERPKNLSPLEKEQYELMLEEQAYPFEEKTITIHKKNIELLSRGVFNIWIDKSLDKLAKLMPARFDKPEESLRYVMQIRPYRITEGVGMRNSNELANADGQADKTGTGNLAR